MYGTNDGGGVRVLVNIVHFGLIGKPHYYVDITQGDSVSSKRFDSLAEALTYVRGDLPKLYPNPGYSIEFTIKTKFWYLREGD